MRPEQPGATPAMNYQRTTISCDFGNSPCVWAASSIEGHQRSHATAYDTARKDLLALAGLGFLLQGKRGRAMAFHVPPDLEQQIGRGPGQAQPSSPANRW